ncbi:MAG: DUF945 family protein [Pseudohongiellaceae bacterium]
MRKPILYAALGLTAAVVAAAAAAPMVIGMGIRDATITGLLELLPPETRSELVITETRFDRGWFGSEGELDVRYLALAQQEELAVRLLFDISHGPLLFTPDGPRLVGRCRYRAVLNSPELTQAMAEIPVQLPEVRLDMLASLDQSLSLNFNMEPFSVNDATGQVSFAGMSGSLIAKPDLSAEVRFNMGELRAEQPASQMGLTIAGMTLESTTQQMNDLLAPNMAMLAIPAISSSAPIPFNVSNISVNSRVQSSTAGPEQIDIHQRFLVASIQSDIPVASAGLTIDISELHGDLIRSYSRMMETVQSSMNTSPPAGTNPVEEIAEEMATVAAQNSLVFHTLAEANAFDGDHSIDLRIDWRGLPGVTDLDSIEPMQILEVLGFDLRVSLDEAAIMSSPLADMVDPYVQQGYLRIENGNILMDASLSDAELTVNGETVPLEQFL